MNYPHLVTIEQQSSTLDSFGQPLESWTEVVKLWSRINPLAGRELQLAKEMHAEITFRMDARYFAGVTPAMRITYTDRTFNILAVLALAGIVREQRIEGQRFLEIYCREVVG